MAIVISTKYVGPTNCRGSRISASDGKNRMTIPYDGALTVSDAHNVAFRAFAHKFWPGVATQAARGETHDKKGYVYIIHPTYALT